MNKGDKVMIVDKNAFGWAKRIDLSLIYGVIESNNKGLFKVKLFKDDKPFSPLTIMFKDVWNFWPSEIEVVK